VSRPARWIMGLYMNDRPGFLSPLIGAALGRIRCRVCGEFVRPRGGVCPNCCRWMDRREATSEVRMLWGSVLLTVAACLAGLALRGEKASRASYATEASGPTLRTAGTTATPPPATPPSAPPASLTTEEIASRCERAVALVRGRYGAGTGFLVGRGLLATNAHVLLLERIEDLRISFPSAPGALLPARLLFEDPSRDLALLAVSTGLTPLEIDPAYRFRRDGEVTVIGNPGTGDRLVKNAVSRGAMSTMTAIRGQDYFRLSIAIDPGDSGGPVIDPSGRVIGVATFKAAELEGIAAGIPAKDLLSAIALARQEGRDVTVVMLAHRARYVAIRLKAIGAGYGEILDAAVAGADRAVAWRLSPGLGIARVQRAASATLRELDARLADEVKPEMDRVADGWRNSAAIPKDLARLWQVCALMRSSIRGPEGTLDSYRSDVSLLKARHRRICDRLEDALSLPGSY
jgi:S1-C subfamily serine protease